MKKWMSDMGNRVSRAMIGRYGMDELSVALIFVSIVLMVVSYFPKVRFLYIPAILILFWSYFRCFSRNIVKRSRERDVFMRCKGKLQNILWIRLLKRKIKDRKHYKYYRCPGCKALIRVPKGKGRIAITCTRCRHEIIRKT